MAPAGFNSFTSSLVVLLREMPVCGRGTTRSFPVASEPVSGEFFCMSPIFQPVKSMVCNEIFLISINSSVESDPAGLGKSSFKISEGDPGSKNVGVLVVIMLLLIIGGGLSPPYHPPHRRRGGGGGGGGGG